MRLLLTIITLLLVLVSIPVYADDDSMPSGGVEDLMNYTNSVENAFAGQKPITDEEFNKVYNQVKAAKDKKKKKSKKDKPFKGRSFNEENNGGYINETAEKNILLSVPTALINGDGTEIPVGHYKIVGEQAKDGTTYINFYQSSTLVARVPAINTDNDFDQTSINFVQLFPYNEERVKVIFGSMDFNAYTFIKMKSPISDSN